MTDLASVRRELDALGFCHLPRLTQLETAEILNSLGSVLHTTDVMVDQSCRAPVSPQRKPDLHTDHSRVRYVAWYCLRRSVLRGYARAIEQLADVPALMRTAASS